MMNKRFILKKKKLPSVTIKDDKKFEEENNCVKKNLLKKLNSFICVILVKQIRYLKLKKELQERFRSEYISQLTHRKAAKASRPIEIGELVLISNENRKRALWPIAKVIEVYPSADGIIRVAKVRTTNGELQGPVKKLVPLEIRPGENVSSMGIPNKQREEILVLHAPSVPKPVTSKKKKKELIVEPTVAVVPVKSTRRGRVIKPVQRFGFNN